MQENSAVPNSRDWWNRCFAEEWDANHGTEQTTHFMQRLLRNVPPTELAWLSAEPRSILDWGCAFGEGVAVLAQRFPRGRVSGLDFAAAAVDEARKRYPDHDFIFSSDGEIPANFDCVVTSNCLEHFESPLVIASSHLQRCKYLYIVLVPLNEFPLINVHQVRFHDESFPPQLGEFTRLHVQPVEVDPALWQGQQLLVIYGSPDYLRERDCIPEPDRERETWQQFYAEGLPDEEEGVRDFNAEFAAYVMDLLPAGGRVLEVGCGSGRQSLALARTGKFSVSLMDFAPAALAQAQRLFDGAGVAAEFHLDDAFALGEADYDLVFASRTLEHYRAENQIALLKGMASRSRGLVFALVPNARCYWYWLWRVQQAAQGVRSFASETPQADLAELFESAGLAFVSRAFLGAGWMKALLPTIKGLDDDLCRQLASIHSSPLILPEHKSLLVGGIGSVTAAQTRVQTAASRQVADPAPELRAALADATAARMRLETKLMLRSEGSQLRASERIIQARDEAVAWLKGELVSRLAQLRDTELAAGQRVEHDARELARLARALEAAEAEVAVRNAGIAALQADAATRQGQVSTLQGDVTALQTEVTALQGELATLRHETAARQSQITAFGSEVAALRQEAATRQSQLTASQEEAAALQRDVVALQQEAVAQQGEITALQREAAARQGEVAALQQAASARQDEVAALQGEATVRQDEISARQREIAGLKADNATRGKEVAALQTEVKGRTAEAARLTAELHQAQAQVTALEASLRERCAEASDLTLALTRRDAELQAIKADAGWRALAPLRRFGETHPEIARQAKRMGKLLWWTGTFQLPSAARDTLRRRRATKIILESGLFLPDWYLAENPDVRRAGVDPLAHFIINGVREGRNPNPLFDTGWYLATNPDVQKSGLNPLVHYARHGAAEGRDPSPRFEGRTYLSLNPDVREAGFNPLAHYLLHGQAENRLLRPAPIAKLAAPTAVSPPAPVETRAPPYDVIVLANIGWEARFQRPQQLATQFAHNGHRVFYVVAFPNIPESETRRYEATAVADHIWQVKLPQSCFFDRYATLLRGPALAQASAVINELAKDFGIVDAVVHVHLPSWVELARALRDRWLWRIIYDCMDDWDGFPGLGPALGAGERQLIEAADAVTVTGSILETKWTPVARTCELVRNGADPSYFQKHCQPNTRFSFRKPVVGFYGALADWVDLQLVADLAANNPQWQFVLAGDVFVNDLCGLDKLRNVRLLGLLPFEEIPLLLWHFDVCLIPFKLNAITHAVDPVKLYEYLSGGKPVVSVPLDELRIYDSVISFADGPQEFARAIASALEADGVEPAAARRAVAANNRWSDRYAAFSALTSSLYPSISIIIIAYNNSELTRACLDSIIANTAHPRYEIIVVDNNSSDRTQEMLQKLATRHPSIKLILNSENRGFAAANNQGLREANGDILILLNNDVVVPRGWLRGMLRCLADPDVGLVGPVTNSVGNEARIEVGYTELSGMDPFAQSHMRGHAGARFEIAMLAMYCVAMRRDVFERIGFLDEAYGIGMFEDDDYSNRVREAGYQVVCTEESFVHHVGQAAFKSLIADNSYQALWDRNKAHYESKWGSWKPHVRRA